MLQDTRLVMAEMWNMGRQDRELNASVFQPVWLRTSSKGVRKAGMAVNRFFWDSITPLLRPVVPEVNMIKAIALRSGTSVMSMAGSKAVKASIGTRRSPYAWPRAGSRLMYSPSWSTHIGSTRSSS